MKVEFWMTGKTDHKYLIEGIQLYAKRIQHFIPFYVLEVNVVKPKSFKMFEKAEAKQLLKHLNPDDFLILLDQQGKEYTSHEFAEQLQKFFQMSVSRLVFLVGGAYGFDESLYQRANHKMSLSKLTFPHDLCRVIFLEQLYRALTIANNHPYQH
jgi:23S rRNA (pseudouridine1915-N3)-methyltransferase